MAASFINRAVSPFPFLARGRHSNADDPPRKRKSLTNFGQPSFSEDVRFRISARPFSSLLCSREQNTRVKLGTADANAHADVGIVFVHQEFDAHLLETIHQCLQRTLVRNALAGFEKGNGPRGYF